MTTLRGAAVTGGAGFIGMHLVRGFDARGARVLPLVHAVNEQSPEQARSLAEAIADPSLLAGIDVLVHGAAVRHRYGVDPATYRASNVDLVDRTMQACARAGVRRFVFVSSVGVYGFPARLPVSEANAYAPRTMYSATKVEAEVKARRTARELGIELVAGSFNERGSDGAVQRGLRVLAGDAVWPPPVWLMRQAGRYLPEYRATRKRAGAWIATARARL